MNHLYYISQGKTPEEHLTNIATVVRGGCRLVQLRLKGISQNMVLKTAMEAKRICNENDTTLIVNDDPQVAHAIDADGVHLGKEDSKIADARLLLGTTKIIGGTANTLEDCLELIESGVDYIGLGPYKFTSTKKNLSPVLGTEGIRKIITALSAKGHKVPVYAIGGVVKEDVEVLLDTGIFGLAVSGLLTNTSAESIAQLRQYVQKRYMATSI
ncbi:thiamine-phosphate pyrophosphorylase [Arenibacter nanhaiticus]|uniref:Thiamine-phosphate synthase n=1 Tax=Arenibacter nanhaiticus TaxID=558155 RepID=A0A1M6DQ64_9FLAO|nr:thiamine phosphate synthase [Arenibacter nanhaiticus]SHI75394.1 thiamine-phosphate pyrophosphorylase [Arenibacter nanhaiticus]